MDVLVLEEVYNNSEGMITAGADQGIHEGGGGGQGPLKGQSVEIFKLSSPQKTLNPLGPPLYSNV